MDDTNQNQNTPAPATPVEESTPVKESSVSQPVKSSPNMMPIVILIIVVVLVVVAAVWFLSIAKTSETGQKGTPQTYQAQPASSFDQDLNSIDVESNDPDFADVDRDLGSL